MDTQEPSLLNRQAEYWRGVFKPEYNNKSAASPPSVEPSMTPEDLKAYWDELDRLESEFGFDTCSEDHYTKILANRERQEAEKDHKE